MLHQAKKKKIALSFQLTSAADDEATLLHLTGAGVKVISCLFRKLN